MRSDVTISKKIPKAHSFRKGKRIYAIFEEQPLISEITDVAAELIDRSSGGTCPSGSIDALGARYGPNVVEETLADFGEIHERLTDRVSEGKRNVGIDSVSIDVPADITAATPLVQKCLSFLASQPSARKTIVLQVSHLLSSSAWSRVFESVISFSRIHPLGVAAEIPIDNLEAFMLTTRKRLRKFAFRVRLSGGRTEEILSRNGRLLKAALETGPVALVVEPDSLISVVEWLRHLPGIPLPLVHVGHGECSLASTNRFGDCQEIVPIVESIGYLREYNRARGNQFHCGAGRWYVAVSARGNIYPCHRFVDDDRYIMGSVFTEPRLADNSERLVSASFKKQACSSCWARNTCAGGCIHEALRNTGSTEGIAEARCEFIRQNVEEAAKAFVTMNHQEKVKIDALAIQSRELFPQFETWPSDDGAGDTFSLQSKGNSMEPFIRAGASLEVSPVHPAQLRIGDIFCFRRNGVLVTHRLMARFRVRGVSIFVEKGDNAVFGETAAQQILGRVLSIRDLETGRVAQLDKPAMRCAAVLVVVSTICLSSVLFLAMYGYGFARALFRRRFSASQALKDVAAQSTLRSHSRVFQSVCRLPNDFINRVCMGPN